MRGLSACLVLLIVIPTVLPGLSSLPSDGEAGTAGAVVPMDGLRLAEVCPGHPVEYIIIENFGGDIDLRGTTISDGEGSIMVSTSSTLPSDAEVAFAADASVFAEIYPDIPCWEYGSPDLAKSGRLALADDGDDVQLWDAAGHLLDLLAYGKSTYSGAGWTGAPAAKGGSADALIRGSDDTNSSSDWSPVPPGRTSLVPADFTAVVEPFMVPENAAERVVREVDAASRKVKAAVYELTDPIIVDAFVRCAERGVNVSVLIEGQPVGGLSEASKAAATALRDAGCDVRMLHSEDVYKRYDYLHAKYLVVDSSRSVIMSENWGSGLWSNRGWGVCAESAGLAQYLEGMFDADFGGLIDVSSQIGPASYSGMADALPDTGSELLRWRASVTPVISPDFSEDEIEKMIASAQNHILVEQMECQEDWLTSPGLLSDLEAAAARGVTVRVLLDNTFSGEENEEIAQALNAAAARSSWNLQAKVISDYHGLDVMHNKGLIVDDEVLVSSINWGDSALHENREVGLLVRSPEISGFFSGYFWQDWADDPDPPTIVLGQDHLQVYADDPVLLDGSNISDRSGISLITWDLDGDGRPDKTGEKIVATFDEGEHIVTVTAYDRFNNSACGTITVTALPPLVPSDASGPPPPLPILLFLVPMAVFIAWKRIKRRKGH